MTRCTNKLKIQKSNFINWRAVALFLSNILSITTAYQYTLNEEETEITFTLNKPSYTGNKSEEVVMKYTIEKKDNEYLLTLRPEKATIHLLEIVTNSSLEEREVYYIQFFTNIYEIIKVL